MKSFEELEVNERVLTRELMALYVVSSETGESSVGYVMNKGEPMYERIIGLTTATRNVKSFHARIIYGRYHKTYRVLIEPWSSDKKYLDVELSKDKVEQLLGVD